MSTATPDKKPAPSALPPKLKALHEAAKKLAAARQRRAIMANTVRALTPNRPAN